MFGSLKEAAGFVYPVVEGDVGNSEGSSVALMTYFGVVGCGSLRERVRGTAVSDPGPYFRPTLKTMQGFNSFGIWRSCIVYFRLSFGINGVRMAGAHSACVAHQIGFPET